MMLIRMTSTVRVRVHVVRVRAGVSQEFIKFRALYANLEEENEHSRQQVEKERAERRALEEQLQRQEKRVEHVRAELDATLERLHVATKRVSQLEGLQAAQERERERERAANLSGASASTSSDREWALASSVSGGARTRTALAGTTQTELAGAHIESLRQELADTRQQLDTSKSTAIVFCTILYSLYFTKVLIFVVIFVIRK